MTLGRRFYSIEAKYRDKLLKRAREQGLKSVEELKESLSEQIAAKKREFNKIDPLRELEQFRKMSTERQDTPGKEKLKRKPEPAVERAASEKGFKSLDDYLKLDKIKDLSRQEVEYLWRAKWTKRDDVLVAVVPFLETFQTMYKYAVRNPLFVLPLPREGAEDATQDGKSVPVELQYIQWQFVGPQTVHCIMTSLAEYKLRQEFATPHTTIQFHLDLAQDKDVVLMNGQVEHDSNISLQDAQLLLLNVQRFFGAMGTESDIAKQRLKLLEEFNQGSADFDINKLITLSQSMEN